MAHDGYAFVSRVPKARTETSIDRAGWRGLRARPRDYCSKGGRMASTTTSDIARTPVSSPTGRAYGGPAHGLCWTIDADHPPREVEIIPGSPSYRLIHHPRTHQPAKDHFGNYLYMPVSPAADGHRSLPCPTN